MVKTQFIINVTTEMKKMQFKLSLSKLFIPLKFHSVQNRRLIQECHISKIQGENRKICNKYQVTALIID